LSYDDILSTLSYFYKLKSCPAEAGGVRPFGD